ncbi:acetyl-CoA synthetase-like protein [Eremomyces bilateralis CBS 781.70]|uniref:Acetyl-CoA synthetase-like protein n=1 Tax=Eremomyces bilateralis CBS 781.70 TaxID=1392243 RepID=A0A6G1G9B1_9PEZI|nr:acetyl-CoA synthetase-like protein [Eremomyces bilateralis CBS 781.70]KAF1814667.1 acetyl-CoA synthetase-like protein [Eremomyces bilateralis CBS 781.70]
MTTLFDSLNAQSNAIAVIVPGNPALSVSYEQLCAEIISFQRKLAALGIAPSSAVSIALPNSYAFIVAFLAASWQRAIAAPLNPAYTQSEFEFYIDDLSSAVALVPQGAYGEDAAAVRAARKYKAAIAECYWNGSEVVLDVKEPGKLQGKGGVQLEKARREDVALVLHTSGTTGRPKAVPLTHRNLTRTMKNIQNTYQLSPADRTLLVMPLFHVHGLLAAFLAPLASGGSVVVPSKFSASEFWHDFNTYKANWYTAVPTIHQILLKSPLPSPKPNIRFIRSCSSPLSPKVFHELEKTFDAPVLEAYAMTEAAHQMTSNPLPPGKRIPGSVGIGQGVEVAILDESGNELAREKEGEISIRGENVTPGYINNDAANKSSFTSQGYFRTGDQGKMDKDGYVFITGRIKELINKGGEKISPIELDNVIAQHPAVAEAVSFAIDDEMYGQDVGVSVVLKDGHQLGGDELKIWMKDRVAKFKLPKKVFFTDIMPKTATGKVQRRMVAQAMLKTESPKSKL